MNGYVLDSHALLWSLAQPERLGKQASRLLQTTDAQMFFSVICWWEIAIKVSVGKLRLAANWMEQIEEHCVARAVNVLSLQPRHCAALVKLPHHHRDPFDRMLAAQALSEKLAVISADTAFERYSVKRIW